MKDFNTYQSHQSSASKSRWAKMTPEDRSAYAKRMVDAREAKRKAKREQTVNENIV